MTERKPAGISFETWIERQIRVAQERGDFDNLPGVGKPLPGLENSGDEMDWLARKFKDENVDIATLLPPALALAKEVEDLPARLAKERTESAVRDIVRDLNERIHQAWTAPQDGPPMRVRPVDVDDVVRTWHAARSQPA